MQKFALAIKSHYQNIHRIASAKYKWKVLKNRSNKIRSNEIRIRQELPVQPISELKYSNKDLFFRLMQTQQQQEHRSGSMSTPPSSTSSSG